MADSGDITAVSLMGTDVERIVNGLELFHETWGALAEIAVACWLLGRQLSVACIAPLILVLCEFLQFSFTDMLLLVLMRRCVSICGGKFKVIGFNEYRPTKMDREGPGTALRYLRDAQRHESREDVGTFGSPAASDPRFSQSRNRNLALIPKASRRHAITV